jgi:hypothetical protein
MRTIPQSKKVITGKKKKTKVKTNSRKIINKKTH